MTGNIFTTLTIVVTEWHLVCDNEWIDPIISTIFMAGLLFGVSIFGPIMDRYGRRNAIQISAIGLVIVQVNTFWKNFRFSPDKKFDFDQNCDF